MRCDEVIHSQLAHVNVCTNQIVLVYWEKIQNQCYERLGTSWSREGVNGKFGLMWETGEIREYSWTLGNCRAVLVLLDTSSTF